MGPILKVHYIMLNPVEKSKYYTSFPPQFYIKIINGVNLFGHIEDFMTLYPRLNLILQMIILNWRFTLKDLW